jgi:hypothetical protein
MAAPSSSTSSAISSCGARRSSTRRGSCPDAFTEAVDDAMAVNLFAAAVALMARLSCGYPAGCLAEEILAVALLDNATVWIDMEADKGNLDIESAQPAMDALRGIFDLFEDDDVLALFEMEEPSDAALAGHSWINRQAGVVDQRVESWFRPFGPVPETGYLQGERAPSTLAVSDAPKLDRADGPGRFRVGDGATLGGRISRSRSVQSDAGHLDLLRRCGKCGQCDGGGSPTIPGGLRRWIRTRPDGIGDARPR